MYLSQLNFQTSACTDAVTKITNAMFSMPNLATPMASMGDNPAATPGTPTKLPGLKNAVIQPMKQANATVARPTLTGYSDIRTIPSDNGIAIAPVMIPAWISRARYLA